MSLFEGYERRIDQINEVLEKYGIESLEEAKKMCEDKGINVFEKILNLQAMLHKLLVKDYKLFVFLEVLLMIEKLVLDMVIWHLCF